MWRRILLALVLAILTVGAISPVCATDLTAEYLGGLWIIGGKGQCDNPDREYILLRENGTFENGRSGKAEAVGFWSLSEDFLHLHLVSSPAFFEDLHNALHEYDGEFHYFHIKVAAINFDGKSFEAIAIIGDQVKKSTAVRCE
jgi:hypothetical protein